MVSTTKTNKPLNPRGNDQSPKGYNRAALYSGKALDFDGVNDQVTFGTISDLTFGTGDFSAVLDWQIDSVSTYSWAIAKNPALDFGIGINNTGGLLRLWIGGTLSLGTENILGSDWKKIAVVRESGVVSAYINGVAISLTETAMAGSIDSGDLIVGSWVSNADFWNGLLNNVRIFNTALTAAQVADLYNNPEKVVPTGVADSALKLWLPMMEGAGTTAYDGSGNGNHGTISGATWTHGIGAPVAQTAVIDWNKPYYFDGSNDYVDADYVGPTGTNPVSVSFWAIIEPSNDYEGLIECQGGSTGNELLILTNNTTNVMRVWCGGSVTNGNADVKDGKLHHIAVTKSGTTLKIYVDGSLDVTGTAGSTFLGFDGGIRIGNNSELSRNLNGFMNEVSVYEGVLSADDVTLLYNNGISISANNSELSLSPSFYVRNQGVNTWEDLAGSNDGTPLGSKGTRLIPQGLNAGRDAFGFLFENVRKQGALNLDGNSWAEVHDNASLDFGTGSFSLEAWAKAKYTSGGSIYNVIMILGGNASTAPNAAILVDNSVRPQAMYNNYASVTPAQTTGDWYHIVAAYDETDMFVFINGAQVLQNGRTAVDITNALVKYIGRDSSSQRYYSDQIAQPRIYNRALTAEEVERNYSAGKNIYK